jgi:hypothetical protein
LDFEDTILEDTEIDNSPVDAPEIEQAQVTTPETEAPEQAGQGHSRQGSSTTYGENLYKQTGSSIADVSDNGLNYMQTGSSIADVSDMDFRYKETGSSIADISDENNEPTVDTIHTNIPRLPGCLDLTTIASPNDTEEKDEDEVSSSKSKNSACKDDKIAHQHQDDSDDDEDSPHWHSWMYGNNAHQPSEPPNSQQPSQKHSEGEGQRNTSGQHCETEKIVASRSVDSVVDLRLNEYAFIVHADRDEDDDEQSCSTQECEVEVGIARAVALFKPGVPRIIYLNFPTSTATQTPYRPQPD